MHYLLHQTIRSSDVRAHARNNFNQLQYLKELIPQLNQFQVPALHIPKPEHKQNWKTLLLDLDETLVHFIQFEDSSSCLNSVIDLNLEK